MTTRWLVDASGRHAFLARRKGLLHRLEEHPTAASWSRWTGVLDLDGRAFMGDPAAPRLKRLRAQRRLATNHFTGRGWWCWVIPLANGKTSVGLVYDKRILDPQLDLGPFGVEHRSTESDSESQAESEDTSSGKPRLGARDRYERFIRAQPGLRELLRDAQMCDDAMTYSFVPYRSSQYMDAGWALVGDAGSFIDPYYSPGLDHVAMSVVATVHVLEQDLAGRLPKAQLLEAISAHNRAFAVSYQRWFEALYLDKYEILGDAELVTASFLVETSLYYMGVLTPILRNVDALRNPVFGAPLPQSKIAYQLAKAFRGRIVRLAALRRENGLYGRRNNSLRMYPKGFGLGARGISSLLRGLRMWCRIELDQILASMGLIGPARHAIEHQKGESHSSTHKAPVGAVPANDGRVR